ncbi:MAG: thiamine biosynthesis protein [Deltaproteobacteria bacterium]|nr:thiamine biosynthesis protein [Deltaproteobacteria bacterium]
MSEQIRAIGMSSGGLDSLLALALVKQQGIEVLAVHCATGFDSGEIRRGLGWLGENGTAIEDAAAQAAAGAGVPLQVIDVAGRDYNQMLQRPRHGYGKNCNPCIDCHALMLRRCAALMAEGGFHFIFTGDVLGQRPKSQRLHALRLIDREAGLENLVVRPLSARALPPTIPEQRGWIDRGRLLDISGRSRGRQIALARELGFARWVSPAGGCLLTDAHYSTRLRDLIDHAAEPLALGRADYALLLVGRHLRLDARVKFVVGRDARDNAALEKLGRGHWLLEATGHPGPTTLVQGEPGDDDLRRIAAITAGYGKGRAAARVTVQARRGDVQRSLEVTPVDPDNASALRISSRVSEAPARGASEPGRARVGELRVDEDR